LNNFQSFLSISNTSSTIFSETFSQYRCLSLIISLLLIAHLTISKIRLEFTGGAITLVHASIVSVLSEPNLTVTQGTHTILASSCMLPLSVTTAQALEIISTTSA